MSKSISKVVGFRQLSSMTLRSRQKGCHYLVVAYFIDGSYGTVGTITSNRVPSDSQIFRLVNDANFPPEMPEIERIVVRRKDVHVLASEYIRSFRYEI